MSAPDTGSGGVSGERDTSSVTRVLSVQSRLSNFLAIGFMSLLGLGSLTWYYAHALSRQGREKRIAQAASTSRAQGDLPLPSLGRIDAPAPAVFEPPAPDPAPLVAQSLAEIPVDQRSPGSPPGAPPSKTPDELALERKLSGAVFSPPGSTSAADRAAAVDGPPTVAGPEGVAPRRAAGELSPLLQSNVTAAARAQVLPARRLLLPKGAFIDCTLETAIDSTLPGMTTCVTATDTFGVDGSVVLMERGTKMVGETRGQVTQGAERIFVLWTEARTPAGVIVPLDSPGAEGHGRWY